MEQTITASERSLPGNWDWGFFSLVLAGVAATLFYSQFHLSHDNSWYLIATRRYMDGATLYVDIIELNPPLAFYLTIPGLALADFAGLSDKVGYVAYVSFLATISNLWAASIVARSAIGALQKSVLLVSAPLITLLLPISEFGQREHLLIIFTLPYFYSAALSKGIRISLAERTGIGLFAVLGFALKPYFYAAALTVTLAKAWQERSFRPVFSASNIAIAVMTMFYLAFILLAHREYVDDIVPLATAVYHSYGFPLWKRLAQPAFLAMPVILLFLASKDRKTNQAAQIFIAAAAGFVLSYFLQFKGWNYQILPSAAYLFLAIAVLSASNRSVLRKRITYTVAVMIAMIGTLGQQVIRGPYQSATLKHFAPYVEEEGTPILVLSSNLSASFPFVNEVDGVWASRFPAQWIVPGAIAAKSDIDCESEPEVCASYDRVMDEARSMMIEDFRRYQPELVFVDDRPSKDYFGGHSFDYVNFLSGAPDFASIWGVYSLQDRRIGYSVWRKSTATHNHRAILRQIPSKSRSRVGSY